MPSNPLELLKKVWTGANTPLVPQSAIKPAQDFIDSPALDRSPMEASIRGFGAGALEGARSLTTPLSMAGMAMPALRALGGGAKAARVAGPTMDLIEANPARQVAPAADDVAALIGDMRRNLAKIPRRQPPMETLGERAAEFAPAGGEGIYNAGRPVAQHGATDLYELLMQRMGGTGRP